jgi:hypothetical protein
LIRKHLCTNEGDQGAAERDVREAKDFFGIPQRLGLVGGDYH